MTESLLKILITNVFTGVDLEPRNLLEYINIVASRLLLQINNDVFHCVFIRLHGNIFPNLNARNLSHSLQHSRGKTIPLSTILGYNGRQYRMTFFVSQAQPGLSRCYLRTSRSRVFRLPSGTIDKSSSRRKISKNGYLSMLIGSEVYSITYLLSEN